MNGWRGLKRAMVLFGFAAGAAQAMVSGNGKVAKNQPPEAVRGEYIVRLKDGLKASDLGLKKEISRLGFKVLSSARPELLRVKAPASILKIGSEAKIRLTAIKSLSSLSAVSYAEPNYIYRIADGAQEPVLPNDPKFAELWGMKNDGQTDAEGHAGKVGADISATKAWTLEKGSRNVVVGIIDTGVDYTHPDLKDNIWSMPGQPNVHGYNAITNELDPMDDHYHGTHCAGTIGASGDNGQGVAGVTWHVQIMGVKFLSDQGGGTLEDAIKAIDWAVAHGAQILSNSWGGGGPSDSLREAIERARDKGVLFVAAAGNDGTDNDASPHYPSSYDVENILAVAASNNRDEVASFSNFGKKHVHIMAPGENILSTAPHGEYKVLSGTSMATPHVSGAAALLLAHEPSLNFTEIKTRLMDSADKTKARRNQVASSGRLNVYNMLAKIFPPGPITVPGNAWSEMIPASFSTPHPYEAKFKAHWEISHPGARFLRIHFAKFETEGRYDLLKITDSDGELVDTMSGLQKDGSWSMDVPGDKATLDFQSDDTEQKYGIDIDGYSWSDYQGR